MADMTLDNPGMAIVEQFEGLELTAYQDVGGVWTIGFGHTGPEVAKGMTITREQAIALLSVDLKTACAAVNHLVKVPLTQNQFDALVDFAYNAGVGALANSTMLKKLNAGDYAAAAEQFVNWDHVQGKVIRGLLRRREIEAALFVKPVAPPSSTSTPPLSPQTA